LFGVFRRLFKRWNSHLLILSALAANIIFMKYVRFMYTDRFFMNYVFFFALGCYCAKNYDACQKILSRSITGLISGAGYLLLTLCSTWVYYSFLDRCLWLLLCFTALVFYFFLSNLFRKHIEGPLRVFISKVSDGSYYIYLAHPLVLYLAEYLIRCLPDASLLTRLLVVCGLVFGTVIPGAIYYDRLKGFIKRRLAAAAAAGQKKL
jgi:membrane-bound acyltransferase YfiQ involved in biofilm formation